MSNLKAPLILWFIATIFFAYQFILRLSVGILREDIIQKFAIDTAAFGSLAGYYYLGYAGMQIPIGIMLDKFNFRIVTAFAILLTILGTLTFVFSENWNDVLLGRFLIGAGSAAGFLTVAKVIKLFFNEKHHAAMIGFSFTFGLTGAVFGGTPMKLIFNNYGYHNGFISLALGGFLIGVIVLLVSDKKVERSMDNITNHPTVRDIIKLLFNPVILITGISGGLMVGPLEGFADVWAMPFFQHVHHLKETDAIFVASTVFLGMCVGGPVLAWLANLTKSNILVIILTGLFTLLVFAIIFYQHNLSFTFLTCLMFYLGILCCYQVLVFAFISKIAPASCASMAIAIVNCLNMSFGHFFHIFISKTIQHNWNGLTNAEGVPVYDLNTYIESLSIIPIACLLGILGFTSLAFKQYKISHH